MAVSYRLSRRAEADFRSIYTFTAEEFGEKQADEYADKLRAGIVSLMQLPRMGRVYRTARGEDFCRLRSRSHWIFYKILNEQIFVVRILHVAMNIDDHLT